MSQKFNPGDRVNIMDGWWDGYQGTIREYLGVVEGLEEHGPLYVVDFPAKPFGIQEAEASMELASNEIFIEHTLNEQGMAIFEASDDNAEMAKWHQEYVTSIPGGFMGIKIGLVPYDGDTPHMHFYRVINEGKEISKWYLHGGGAICINQDKYFEQGKHEDRLTHEECVALREFLKSPSGSHPTMSTWEHILMEANHMNTGWKLPKNLRIPDYVEDMESTTEDEYIRESAEESSNDHEEELLLEMAEIYPGYMKKKNSRITFHVMVVDGGEGENVPHVHVAFSSNKASKENTAYICLNKAAYAPHHKNGLKVNARQLDALIAFFNTIDPNSKDTFGEELTCWEVAVRQWFAAYGKKTNLWEIDDNGKYIMPDYSKLNDNE